MTTSVRRATADDAEIVSALNADVQAIHAAAVPWWFKPPGPDTFSPADAAVLIAEPDHVVFVAEVDGTPAGYAYAEIVRREETGFHYAYAMIYLHHISVRPDFQRRGIGSALMAALRAVGKDLDITRLAADVWTFNEGSRAFLRQQGLNSYVERLWDR